MKNLENNTKMILAVLVTAIVCIAGTFVVAGNGNGGENNSSTVTVAGSTTVQPLMVEFQEEFEKYSNMKLSVTGGGSGAGVETVKNGIAEIGMLSRDLKSTEAGHPTIIAKDGVVILVHTGANVSNLTLEQIAKIYSGEYTNWNQVGGANLKINPIIREEGSGTRDCLDTILATVPGFNTNAYNKYPTQSSTGSMLTQIQNVSGSIGYVNLGVLSSVDKSKTAAVTVDGVEVTSENVINGTYEISRNLILITKDAQPSGEIQFFLNWILSEQGQKIVEDEGFVSIRG